MKITVIGSHLCPDTLYALNRLSEANAEIDFKNLSASLSDLKVYLSAAGEPRLRRHPGKRRHRHSLLHSGGRYRHPRPGRGFTVISPTVSKKAKKTPAHVSRARVFSVYQRNNYCIKVPSIICCR